MQLYNHNPSAQIINCTGVSKHQLLKLLLMFVTYCLDVLKQSPASIPGVLSALRYNLRHRLADCTVFDDALLGSVWHASLVPINDRDYRSHSRWYNGLFAVEHRQVIPHLI